MKKILLCVFACYAVTFTYSQSLQWTTSSGGNQDDNGRTIAIDHHGNVYTAGVFSGTADFDPSVSTLNFTSNGLTDMYIQKLDPSGNLLWAVSLGGSQEDIPNDIAVDENSGDIYVVGQFRSTVDFDPSTSTNIAVSNGNYDICIIKFNGDGNFQWVKTFGGIGWDYAFGCDIDASGNLGNVGVFQNSADLDPGAGTSNFTSAGLNDTYIQKLSPSGNLIWVKCLGGSLHDDAWDVSFDYMGNIYVTGAFQGTCDFDPSASTSFLTSNGDFDIYIIKLDASGNLAWAKSIGGLGMDKGYYLQSVWTGHVVVTGYYNNTVDFNPSASTAIYTSAGAEDCFILKLDTDGNFIWAKSIGGSSTDIGLGIAADWSNIIIAGQFKNTVDFDPSASTLNVTSLGDLDGFWLNLDVAGNFVSVKQTGGIGTDFTRNIDMKDGMVATTGAYEGAVDFNIGGSSIVFNSVVGSTDAFVQKYKVANFTIDEISSALGTVFPNPVNNHLNVTFEHEVHNATLNVYNNEGKLVSCTSNINGNNSILDVSNLASGAYYLQLSEGGHSNSIKFIKN